MAICLDCNQEMKTAESCSVLVVHIIDEEYPVIRYGSERGWPRPRRRCGDCGVLPGGAHHLGCDVAECPRCRRQMFSCYCRFDEYGTDEMIEEYE
jgi:hypothetical protein